MTPAELRDRHAGFDVDDAGAPGCAELKWVLT